MPRINLLPWREAQRSEKQRQFTVIAVGAVIVMALGIVLVHVQYASMLEAQKSRNQFMEATIKKVEKEIEEIKTLQADKKALLARMEVIQKLQRSRPEIVHLFEEIARTTPEGVYLVKTTRTGNTISIEGSANSNDSVSAFMRLLDDSPWLANPRLEVIENRQDKTGNSSWFKLTVLQEVQESENKDDNTDASKKPNKKGAR